jgi:hypothetical protein
MSLVFGLLNKRINCGLMQKVWQRQDAITVKLFPAGITKT